MLFSERSLNRALASDATLPLPVTRRCSRNSNRLRSLSSFNWRRREASSWSCCFQGMFCSTGGFSLIGSAGLILIDSMLGRRLSSLNVSSEKLSSTVSDVSCGAGTGAGTTNFFC
uniref:(northern house mosquito) hypothetical protein n=1 Tax=Culex pipiens TaxID=7175 RepID=A0A8D8BGN3_CULPI